MRATPRCSRVRLAVPQEQVPLSDAIEGGGQTESESEKARANAKVKNPIPREVCSDKGEVPPAKGCLQTP